MRLFLLIASVFALISLALVVSQHPRFVEQTRQLISPDASPDEDRTNASGNWEDQFDHTSVIYRQQDSWQALSGFPSFVRLSFPLPQKAELVDGRLRLELHTQLAQSGVGSVRVAVNDERRAEVVLNTGQEQRSLLLALTPDDLAGAYVTVSLSAHGDAFQGACPSRPARGVVIDVLPSSGLELAHVQPLDDPMDIWIAHSHTARIPLGSATDTSQQADQVLLAARLRQAGLNSGFARPPAPQLVTNTDDTVNTVARLMIDRGQNAPLLYNRDEVAFSFKDPNTSLVDLFGEENVKLVDLMSGTSKTNSMKDEPGIVDTSLQSFFRSNRWRLAYDLVETNGARAPSRLQLTLNVAEQLPGADWLVNVSLNDTLLSSNRLQNPGAPYTSVIPLPAVLTQVRNEIVIDLKTTRDDSDLCDPGLEMAAQLLPGSGLEGIAFLSPEMPAYLIQTLAGDRAISFLSEPTITLAQAAASAEMLAYILPKQASVNTPNTDAYEVIKIETLTKAGLEERLKTLELAETDKSFWIVSRDTRGSEGQGIRIIPLTPERAAVESLLLVENSIFLFVEA